MYSPFQEHSSTDIQSLRAARLEQLIDYVAEPYGFLTCKSCRVALPLSRVPAHSSSPKYHDYSHKDCVDALKAWQALYISSRPIKLRNEDRGFAELSKRISETLTDRFDVRMQGVRLLYRVTNCGVMQSTFLIRADYITTLVYSVCYLAFRL
jgi:hypothetical protein